MSNPKLHYFNLGGLGQFLQYGLFAVFCMNKLWPNGKKTQLCYPIDADRKDALYCHSH